MYFCLIDKDKKNNIIKKYIILLFLHTLTYSFSQPTGEERYINLSIQFKDDNGIIYFNKHSADTLYSENKSFKVTSSLKEYFTNPKLGSLLDCFFENAYTTDTINYFSHYKLILNDTIIQSFEPWWFHTTPTTVYYQYNASYNQNGTKYYIPKNDLIINFYKGEKIMHIRFELYKIYDPYIFLPVLIDIKFQEGNFKITDAYKPKLIAISDGEY